MISNLKHRLKHQRFYPILSIILVWIMLFAFSIIPIEFCRAFSSPTFWSSRNYVMGIAEDGDVNAGFKGFTNEYLYMKTSHWTQLAVNLQHGGLIAQAELTQIPGTILPLGFTLTYSSVNAGVDIGLGRGWISNIQSCVLEDSGTGDLTFITADGAKLIFDWDSGSSTFVNPSGFTGKATKNQDDTYTIQTLSGVYYQFNSDGKMTEITSKIGGIIQIGYDTAGKPITISDPISDRVVTITWNTGGKIESVENMVGHAWTLEYSQDGTNLIEITQPSDENPPEDIHCSFEYDTNHKLVAQVDFEGFEYGITYHSTGYQTGKVASIIEPTVNAATTSFTYEEEEDNYDKKTTVTDAVEHDIYYYFNDASGHLEKICQLVDSVEIKATYSYNTLGLLATSKESYDKQTTYTYDSVGHLIQITFPPPEANGVSSVKEFVYSPENDIDGKLIQMKEKVTSSLWATTNLSYTDNDAPNNPSVITDPLNHVTTINYNVMKQPIAITEPTDEGTKTTEMEYDEEGNLQAILNALEKLTTFTQDDNGNVTEVVMYDGPDDSFSELENISYDFSCLDIWKSWEHHVDIYSGQTNVRNGNGSIIEITNGSGCSTSSDFIDTTNNADYLVPRGMSLDSFSEYQPNPITTTDTTNHVTTYSFLENGMMETVTDYLGRTTSYSFDDFGRIDTITRPFGQEVSYSYNLNSQVTEKEMEGVGTIFMQYNDRGEITSYTDPIEGTFEPTYNVRGDVTTDNKGSYTYDLMGRPTGTNFTGGGSETTSYSADGNIIGMSGSAFESDELGNLLSWDDNEGSTASFSYTTERIFGLPNSMTGTNQIGSYSYTYNNVRRLLTVSDTTKGQTYSYAWETDGSLVSLQNQTGANLTQTYDSKILDQVEVKKGEDTYLQTDLSLDSLDLKTDYSFEVFAGTGNTFSETYSVAYDTLKRVSEIEKSNQETVTYSYNTTVGDVTTIDCSDLGEYSISRDTKGRISSITYPGSQGTETYTYDDANDQGKLSTITYPGNRSISIDWDNRDRVSNLSFNDNGDLSSYQMAYTSLNKIKQFSISEDGIPASAWTYFYGPFGLEKAILKDSYNTTLLTQDYTVDPMGRILSMTYTPTTGYGTYTGELYFHYDNDGNIALLTDNQGNPRASFEYDMITGNLVNTWNPDGIITTVGTGSCLEIAKPWDGSICISGCGSLSNQNNYSAVDINHLGTDLAVRAGNTDAKPCGGGIKITEKDIRGQHPCFKEKCFSDCWKYHRFGSGTQPNNGTGWDHDYNDILKHYALADKVDKAANAVKFILDKLLLEFGMTAGIAITLIANLFKFYAYSSGHVGLAIILAAFLTAAIYYALVKKDYNSFMNERDHKWITNAYPQLQTCADECCDQKKVKLCCEKNRKK